MTEPRSPSQQTLPRPPGRLPIRPASLSREAPMSQLISPPTDAIVPEIDAGTNPATTPRAEVSTPGQLYFSVPVAGPTGSAAVIAPVGRPPEDVLTRSCLEIGLG